MPLLGFFSSLFIGCFVTAGLFIGNAFAEFHPVLRGLFALVLPIVITLLTFPLLVELDWHLVKCRARRDDRKRSLANGSE